MVYTGPQSKTKACEQSGAIERPTGAAGGYKRLSWVWGDGAGAMQGVLGHVHTLGNCTREKSGALVVFVTNSSLTYGCKITGEPV